MLDDNFLKPNKINKKSSYHHGDLKESIFSAVVRLISERKSLDFQLRDIAILVETSVPAIYRHFESRQTLLVETAVRGYNIQKQLRDIAIEKHNATPLHKLMGIGYAYFYFACEYPGYFTLIKNLETKEILSSDEYQKLRKITTSLVNNVISDCVKFGYFKNIEEEIIATFLQSMTYGYAQIHVINSIQLYAPNKQSDSNLLRDIFKISLSGIMTPLGIETVDDALINPMPCNKL